MKYLVARYAGRAVAGVPWRKSGTNFRSDATPVNIWPVTIEPSHPTPPARRVAFSLNLGVQTRRTYRELVIPSSMNARRSLPGCRLY